MKKIHIVVLLMAMVSCDPISHVEYKIYNYNDSDAVIELLNGVGYTIHHNDSVTIHISTDNASAVLKQDEILSVYYEWINNRVGSHIPLWKQIVNIHIGDSIVPPSFWGNADSWKTSCSKECFSGEGIDYYLFLE